MLLNNKNDRPVFIVITGLPGAGKSTLLAGLRVSRGDETAAPVVHSSDALRQELYGDAAVQGDNSVLFAELYRRILADLRRMASYMTPPTVSEEFADVIIC